MNILAPLPDETIDGYIGRLKRRNLCSSNSELFTRLASYKAIDIRDDGNLNPITFLAEVSGISLDLLTRQHTMLPCTSFVDWFDQESEVVTDFTNEKYLKSALRSWGSKAYLCPSCVKEDLDLRGITYWHRIHHLQGIDWCIKHSVALRQCIGIDSFDQSPMSALAASLTIDNENLSMERDHHLVGRYARISEALLTEVSRPYHAADVSKLIQKWAWAQGLRFPTKRTPHLLSDWVSECFPKSWLSSHFPATRSKVKGAFFHCIDHTYYRPTQACKFSSYVLALALIFETTDEALNALSNMPAPSFPHRHSIPKRLMTWSNAEVIEIWRRHFGNYKTIAEEFGCSQRCVRSKLARAGLPAFLPCEREFQNRFQIHNQALA
jgi:TniQ